MTTLWWGEAKTVKGRGLTSSGSTSVGFISQRRNFAFYSKCYGKPLEGCGMICFAVLYFKKMSLAIVWRMDSNGSRVEGGKKLGSCCYCLGERVAWMIWDTF